MAIDEVFQYFLGPCKGVYMHAAFLRGHVDLARLF